MATADQRLQAQKTLSRLGFQVGEMVELSSVKKRYRELAKQHHPDRGGDAEKMARINRDYTIVLRGYAKN